MEKRPSITTERRHAYLYEPAGTEPEKLFEAVVKSLEKMPPERRQEWLGRWDRAAFYAQGVSGRGRVEYRTGLRPTPSVSTITKKIEKQADISLFYRSGMVASATLCISVIASTVSNIFTVDLGAPIALALFGIFLAFSVEAVRFKKRVKRLA